MPAETIREHLRRRSRLAAWLFVGGLALMLLAVWLSQFAAWAFVLLAFVFCLAIVGSNVLTSFMRCPNCGRWFSRFEYAAFAWPLVKEPDKCRRCGESYDAPWRQYRG